MAKSDKTKDSGLVGQTRLLKEAVEGYPAGTTVTVESKERNMLTVRPSTGGEPFQVRANNLRGPEDTPDQGEENEDEGGAEPSPPAQ
jgi:hypothetical protein